MTVQTLPKTKWERIKDLVLAGLDAKQIADELNTTLDYVYKVKGKLKKKGINSSGAKLVSFRRVT